MPYFLYQHEVLRGLEIVGLVGAPSVGLQPVLPVVEADLAEAAAIVPPASRPLVVLHPGAGAPRRRWPAARFGALAAALSSAGAAVVVTGVATSSPEPPSPAPGTAWRSPGNWTARCADSTPPSTTADDASLLGPIPVQEVLVHTLDLLAASSDDVRLIGAVR